MTKFQKEQTKQAVLYMCRLTFKTLAIGLLLAYGLVYAVLNIKSAEAASLKPEAVINDNVVKASDLFDDIPVKKDAIVGNAPSPGQSIVLSARTLERIAGVYDIDWKASSPADQIVVSRSMQTIPANTLVEILKKDLQSRGVAGNFGVTLNNVAPVIVLPGDLPATAEIAQMSYTPGRDVFTATLAAPTAANPVKTLTVSGLIEKMVQLPVLSASATAGDIISSSDIEWVDVPVRNTVYDTIADADTLIGKTPLRSVEAGIPVRKRDITAPQLVARGDEVLLQFNEGGLQLTAKGKAMQNGAEGEVIRIVNLSSNQSLRGEVVGNKMIKVQ